jgi:hypothetical protein
MKPEVGINIQLGGLIKDQNEKADDRKEPVPGHKLETNYARASRQRLQIAGCALFFPTVVA